MKPQDIPHHNCPRCRKQATVLVDVKNNAHFYRDGMGNIQYLCTHCYTTFSIDNNGRVTAIRPGL